MIMQVMKIKLLVVQFLYYYEIYDKFFFNPGIAIDFDSVNANSDASSLIKRREGDFFTTKIFYNFQKIQKIEISTN
jgi:hypothetical protein